MPTKPTSASRVRFLFSLSSSSWDNRLASAFAAPSDETDSSRSFYRGGGGDDGGGTHCQEANCRRRDWLSRLFGRQQGGKGAAFLQGGRSPAACFAVNGCTRCTRARLVRHHKRIAYVPRSDTLCVECKGTAPSAHNFRTRTRTPRKLQNTHTHS